MFCRAIIEVEGVGCRSLDDLLIPFSDTTSKEWHAFVGKVQKKFSEADNEIPILPPRDVIVSKAVATHF